MNEIIFFILGMVFSLLLLAFTYAFIQAIREDSNYDYKKEK